MSNPVGRQDLLDAGRIFLERWTAWLQENPTAEEALVREAMERGELPPESAQVGGRPTKLTPETHDIIIAGIRTGMYYEDAANLAGVSYDSLNNWRKRGAAEAIRRSNPRIKEGTKQWEREQPFFEFFEACKKAEGGAVLGWLQTIETASSEHWQAAAWKAERRYPERYGRQRYEHTGADGAPIQSISKAQVDLTSVSDDDLYDAFTTAVGAITQDPARAVSAPSEGVGGSSPADGADEAA